uniref:Uncharacterized protein n=1 Tax=Arion vulgaris TaxID=1028688 RepID=A0A0B7BAS6_9EUPU
MSFVLKERSNRLEMCVRLNMLVNNHKLSADTWLFLQMKSYRLVSLDDQEKKV